MLGPSVAVLAALLCGSAPRILPAQDEMPRFDFETGDLQGWRVTEGKFDRLLCDRPFFHHTKDTAYTKQGTYFLSTLERSDGRPDDSFTGLVESPRFALTGRHVCFLVGGGKGPGVYVALCRAEDEEELRAARGDNAQKMRRHIWDVAEFVGREVYLKLVDDERGGWGHITFDDFRPPTPEELATIPIDSTPAPPSPFNVNVRASCEAKITSLRLAIADLRETFGDKYPRPQQYLDRLDALQQQLDRLPQPGSRNRLQQLAAELDTLSREALIASPLLTAQPILYVAREQYRRDHHNTETLFQNGAAHGNGFRGGGALRMVDFAVGGQVTTLLDAPEGVIRDPEVHFSGRRVVFSYRQSAADDYHIWEINADGSGLRQLTDGSGLSDIDPMYLPSGQIVFSSTRDPKVCACNVHVQGNLFRMEADGADIHQLGRNTLFEDHPSLLPDGRILYSRWEYVDKHFGPAQGLWTMNPDGTAQAVYYGNNAWWPGAILDGRLIPGTQRVIGTLGSCHAPPFGEIAVIDRNLGFDGQGPIIKSWPQVPVKRNGYDHVWGLPLRYEDPYPLSDKCFLASRTIERARSDGYDIIDKYGIFLLDIFGNEVLIHADQERSCFDPLPLSPRPRPPVIPDRVDFAQTEGVFLVHDVYEGTGMQRVERGAAKWLRVVESPPKRLISQGDFNNGARQAPVMNWSDVVNKRIIGTVPIEADGSAHFTAPADVFLFFQLLDENGMMIQSMRSGTTARPGEVASCIGCHEERGSAVMLRSKPVAARRPPSRPEPWYGPPREFSYAAEVQPVFDRHCVKCHDHGERAGGKLNLSGDKTLLFSVSYLELHRKSGTHFKLDPPVGGDSSPTPLIKVVNHGPPEVLPAYSWGSHRSKIVEVIRSGHNDVKLDRESFDRLVTWIDMNAVYYGSFASARPGSLGGRSPLAPPQIKRLGELTGVNVADEIRASWVNLTRPELSLCLLANLPQQAGGRAEPGKARFAGTADAAYQEALSIIKAGADELARAPRMDMPGATPHESCTAAEAVLQARQEAEAAARAALMSRG